MKSKIDWAKNSSDNIAYTFYFLQHDDILNNNSNINV